MNQQQLTKKREPGQEQAVISSAKVHRALNLSQQNYLSAHNLLSNHGMLSYGDGSLQAKLKISQPDDIYEREADLTAEHVMRMKEGEMSPSVSDQQTLQRKNEEGVDAGTEASSTIKDVLKSTGEPLDKGTRDFFEPRFKYDFSNVRVHQDRAAAESAQTINALAYTSGSHIVFSNGQFSTQAESGKRLLGHELAHVVQQQSAGKIMRTPAPDVKTISGLSSYDESTRKKITYQSDPVDITVKDHFPKKGEILVDTPRKGFAITYIHKLAKPGDDWLKPNLNSIARAIFGLSSSNSATDPVQTNLTIIQELDLSGQSSDTGVAGPKTRFRFACAEFDSSTDKSGKIRNVQIIIEDIGSSQAVPNASLNMSARIARFEKEYGFKRATITTVSEMDAILLPDKAKIVTNDIPFTDTDYNDVLIAISLIPDNLLKSISGTKFNRKNTNVGKGGEAADCAMTITAGKPDFVINVYNKAMAGSTSSQDLAFLMTHEIGHALALKDAVALKPPAPDEKKDYSDEVAQGFKDAAKKDGVAEASGIPGKKLKGAITGYGNTSWGECFAESFSMFFNEPKTLQLLRKNIYDYFLGKYPAAVPATPAVPVTPVPAATNVKKP
ncbi:MAG: DUF4157 domain-containing protein [Bacteroidetes bacterium]|nr:DUF4157 domain-containing protein [Bacteroidota bacterium]